MGKEDVEYCEHCKRFVKWGNTFRYNLSKIYYYAYNKKNMFLPNLIYVDKPNTPVSDKWVCLKCLFDLGIYNPIDIPRLKIIHEIIL